MFSRRLPPHSTPHRESLTVWQKLFYFDWKVFVRSVSSVEVFVFLLCFPFCALGKVLGPRLIKWLRVFFFLSGIYYWHFPGIGLGTPLVSVQYLILPSSSQENHVVQSCRLNSLVQHPLRFWLRRLYVEGVSHIYCRRKIIVLSQRQAVHDSDMIVHLNMWPNCSFFVFFPCVCIYRWAGGSHHVSPFPVGSSHDRQGAWFLERHYCHGLFHLWLFPGRSAARTVQVALTSTVVWDISLYLISILFSSQLS